MTPIAEITRNNEGMWCIDVAQLGLGVSGRTRDAALDALREALRDETVVGADVPHAVMLVEEMAIEPEPEWKKMMRAMRDDFASRIPHSDGSA